jgi:hypothetical protein
VGLLVPPPEPLQVQVTPELTPGKVVLLGVPALHWVYGAQPVSVAVNIRPLAVPQVPLITNGMQTDPLKTYPELHVYSHLVVAVQAAASERGISANNPVESPEHNVASSGARPVQINAAREAEQATLDPPPDPLQFQLTDAPAAGKAGLAELAPELQ